MNKKFSLLTILLCATTLFAGSDKATRQRGLYIFLDDFEAEGSKFGALAGDFISVLVHGEQPILVSANLVTLLFKKPSLAIEGKSPEELIERYNFLRKKASESVAGTTPREHWERFSIILHALDVKKLFSEKWIVKAVNKGLILLLPQKYLEENGISKKDALVFTFLPAPTEQEKKLGIKINHMRSVPSPEKIEQQFFGNMRGAYFMDAVWNKKHESTVFVTNAQYEKYEMNPPVWSFILSGHSAYLSDETRLQMAGIPLRDFHLFLKFISSKIKTKILFYMTCSAMGNSQKLLDTVISNDLQGYNDTPLIVTQGVADAPSRAASPQVNVIDGVLAVNFLREYVLAMESMIALESSYYPDIQKAFFSNSRVDSLQTMIQNSLHVKMPKSSHFVPLNPDNNATVITDVMAKTRQTPLVIDNRIDGKHTEGLLLYAADIPFEVIINSNDVDQQGLPIPLSIASMHHSGMHHVRRLSSETYHAYDLLEHFLGIKGISSEKIFLIDEVADDYGNLLESVVIRLAPEGNSILFNYQGELMSFENTTVSNGPVFATDRQKEEHASLLERVLNGTAASQEGLNLEAVAAIKAAQEKKIEQAKITEQQ